MLEKMLNIIQKLLQKWLDVVGAACSSTWWDRRNFQNMINLNYGDIGGVFSKRFSNNRGHRCPVHLRVARKHPQQEFLQVDTSIYCYCGGAFGLEKVIRDRSEKGGIGFSAEVHSRDNENCWWNPIEVEPSDLISYGLIPEFIGRLPVVATLKNWIVMHW